MGPETSSVHFASVTKQNPNHRVILRTCLSSVGHNKYVREPLLALFVGLCVGGAPFVSLCAGGARPRSSSVMSLVVSLLVSIALLVPLALHALLDPLVLRLLWSASVCWCMQSALALPSSGYAGFPRRLITVLTLFYGYGYTNLTSLFWTLLLGTFMVPNYLILLLCTVLISI